MSKSMVSAIVYFAGLFLSAVGVSILTGKVGSFFLIMGLGILAAGFLMFLES